jgi:hypothetical protein
MTRRKRAYRQGDLDGLCSVYAVVNALRHVLQLPGEQCHKVFEKLIKALEQRSRCLHQPLLRGICFRQLKQLVMVASQCRLKGQKLTFATRPLRLKRQQRTLADLWTALDEEVGLTCVACGFPGHTENPSASRLIGTNSHLPVPVHGPVQSDPLLP